MSQAVEYLDSLGNSPYGKWFDGLHADAAARVKTAVTRLESGNSSNVSPVGSVRGIVFIFVSTAQTYCFYSAEVSRNGSKLILTLQSPDGTITRDDYKTRRGKFRCH
jgi:putative component of toxin-antitoxin plasmid stabilization module